MWRSRMFWRLFSAFAVLQLMAIALLGVLIAGRVERHLLAQIERSLRTKAILVREVVRDRLAIPPQDLQQRVVSLRKEIATRITLLAGDGRVLADSEEDPAEMENHADRPEIRDAREARFGTITRHSSTVHEPMMYLALRTDGPSDGVVYVRVALPLDSVRSQLGELSRVIWSVAPVMGGAALVLAFWLARRIAGPLQDLTQSAERIAQGDYGHKVYAAGGDEIGVLGRTFNQMSERLATQFAQLAEDRQQLRMILSGMVEGVIALDAEQRILFANERAAQLLGFNGGSATGRKLWEVIRRRSLQELVRRALAEPDPCVEEINWEGPTARCLTVHAARLPGWPPRGAVLVLHDTTELRRLERLRQEFVANVSHELKTPLSVIKACVETLLAGAIEDPEHRGPFLERIGEQADRLHLLILDLLSLARIESGSEAFSFEAVPLEPAVRACCQRHRARAEARNQVLEIVPPLSSPGMPLGGIQAWADEEAINQILDNLVDNALKYTPEGGRVSVGWKVLGDLVSLEVRDTGIGIPEQDLPRIFERFYRVDKARSRELGGTGLGLSIVKHLTQGMHGTIHATSQLGQGSTFSIHLPLARLE